MNNELKKYSNDVRLKIDSALERYIEDYNTPASLIVESMKYSIFAGGKRIRPLLAFLSAEMFDIDVNTVVPFACAIEMVHTYSLIHDDLPAMDDDDMRRGKPTNHIKYGEDIAILAGDGLLTHAFEVLSYLENNVDYRNFIRVLRAFTKASGYNGMIAGQVADVLNEQKDVDFDTLKYIHKNKTGEMISVCVKVPALIAGIDEQKYKKVCELGDKLGLLFQITDDILDVKGSVEKLGKTPGKDEKNNKCTYVTLFGIEKAQEYAKNCYNDIERLLEELEAGDVFRHLAQFIFERDH